jgi:hypothetical protein
MTSWLTGLIAAAALLASMAAGVAASISGSNLPGRERYRFIDPPGAGLLQPSQPSTILPWEAGPPRRDCRLRVVRGKQRWHCPRAR